MDLDASDREVRSRDQLEAGWRDGQRRTAPATAMPRFIFPSIPRPPRMPVWPGDPTIEEAPSSLDLDITQTRLEPWFPATSTDDYFASEDGLVCVPRPTSEGWWLERERFERRGARFTVVVCRRDRANEPFSMVATDCELAPGTTLGWDQLERFLRDGDPELDVLHSERRVLEHERHAACEVTIEVRTRVAGRHRRIRRTDRVLITGPRVLSLRVEGPRSRFVRYATERERFLEHTRFAHLR